MPTDCTKITGFQFWQEVLKSPKYIAAPMVDMSELSFRLLCRRYECHLCYTPMINSHQFLQDTAYRKSVFTTCEKDRPLIAQFCANDPDTFVAAGKLVEDYCDAIDLNLGCPQGIARKGHYGAFLQDELDLVEKLIVKAAAEFKVPVTCKVRVLPGPVENTIEYAKMLERAGCSVIAVHGRTRDQKGDGTGLASWEVIKRVKESVGIPVISNGNVLDFQDVLKCLEFTKADGVMSAEGLLHNPAIFCDTNPLVWEIVDEYLDLAKENHTPIKHIRTHLFRLLQYSLEKLTWMRDRLARANKLEQFRIINSDIRKILEKNLLSADPAIEQVGISSTWNNRGSGKPVEKLTKANQLKKKNELESDWIQTGLFSLDLDDIITDDQEASEQQQISNNVMTNEEDAAYHLPVWQCHSRPHVVVKSDGSSIIVLVDEGNSEMDPSLTKYDKRRQRILESCESHRDGNRIRRKATKLRRKEERGSNQDNAVMENKDVKPSQRITKRQLANEVNSRLELAMQSGIKICIDLDFANVMSEKELNRLSTQLCRIYGSNRQSLKPFHLCFTSFCPSDPFYNMCCAKNDGFLNYKVDMRTQNYANCFTPKAPIYLTPDSDNPLDSLESDRIYIIGGLVEDTVQKLAQSEQRGSIYSTCQNNMAVAILLHSDP